MYEVIIIVEDETHKGFEILFFEGDQKNIADRKKG